VLIHKYGNVLLNSAELTVTAVDDGLRRFLVLESDSKEPLEMCGYHVFSFVSNLQKGEEPMINILAYYRDRWQIFVFPRDKHRPWQYFEEGEKNILLSPASVDMGGTLITPLEKDFNKITREDIIDIFSQISFSEVHFNALTAHVITKLQTDD